MSRFQQRDAKGRFLSFYVSLEQILQGSRAGAKVMKSKIGKVDSRKVRTQTGLSLTAYLVVIDTSAVWHIIKNHGGAREAKRGQKPISLEDISLVGEILKYGDLSCASRSKIGLESISAEYAIEGWHYRAIFEIRTKRRELALKTLHTCARVQ